MQQADQAAISNMLKLMSDNNVEPGKPVKDLKVFALIQMEMLKTEKLQSTHRSRLKAILEKQGWPGRTLVGADGAHAAWLIVQHADAEPQLQQKCLDLMTAAPSGEVENRDIAYLTDRILVGQKKPQKYGTQLGAELKPLPIEDDEGVDARRKAMGLPTLADYLKSARDEVEKLSKSAPKK